jgi:hypothetical protein
MSNKKLPYVPIAGEVAGFDLCGWKQPDGTILLGSGNNAVRSTRVKAFPEEVELCGSVWSLESVKWQENGFGWGMYA